MDLYCSFIVILVEIRVRNSIGMRMICSAIVL